MWISCSTFETGRDNSGDIPRKKLLSTENGETIRPTLPEPTGTQTMPLYSLHVGNKVLCIFSFGF